MGQKSNLLTLRTYKENLDSRSLNPKEFLDSFQFLNTFKRSLDKKGILITFSTLNTNTNTCYLTLGTFYKSHLLMKYRRKMQIKNQKNKNLKLKKQVITDLFNQMVKHKVLVLNVFLLNIHLNKKLLTELYFNFIKFKNILFGRRFNFFLDFLKLTSLLLMKKINANTFLNILGTIFQILPKRLHGRFFSFLKVLFKFIIDQKNTTIAGLKFTIAGKLKGKLRSSSLKFLLGKIANQTISSEIDFAKLHVHTIYGCFGLKIWMNYKNKNTNTL